MKRRKGTLLLILHRLSHRFSRYHTVSHADMHGATNEKFHKSLETSRDISSRAQAYLPAGFLGQASAKIPDLAFEQRQGDTIPFLVVEVGFSQPYDSPKTEGLLQDAQYWLEQTKGRVRCAVLVSITESKSRGEPDTQNCEGVSTYTLHPQVFSPPSTVTTHFSYI